MAAQAELAFTGAQSQNTDEAAVRHFTELQARLLGHYGVRAASRFVRLERPAMTAHVLVAGRGEPVVILHGGDGEAVNWAPLLAPLQDRVAAFAADRPGCGLSDAFDYRTVDLRSHAADFVASLLDGLGLESASLVAGSMGGFFALAAALAHPSRVRRLVLVGFAAGMTPEIGPAMRKICASPETAAEFMKDRDTMEAQKGQYRDMFHFDPARLPDLYFESRIAGLRLPSERGTWATLLTRIGSADGLRPEVYLGDDLPRVAAPTLMLWGEHDFAPAELGRLVTARIPRSTFVFMEGVGHFPFLEAPERTAQLIAEFVHARA